MELHGHFPSRCTLAFATCPSVTQMLFQLVGVFWCAFHYNQSVTLLNVHYLGMVTATTCQKKKKIIL